VVCGRHPRKVDIRLHGKENSKLPWRKAGQPRHLVDVVDSDQWVVNKELSPCGARVDLIPVSIHHEYDSSPGEWSREPSF